MNAHNYSLGGFASTLSSGTSSIIGGLTNTNKNFFPYVVTIKEDEKKMETLYSVIVIDKERDILIDEKVVAKNQESAKFNADVYDHLKKSGLTLDDVTVIVNQLGLVEVAEYLE